MNYENVKKVLDWLEKEFGVISHEEITNDKGILQIDIFIYDSIEGYNDASIYFNKEGNVIPNYARQIELKQQIKELQAELEKLQKN